MIGPWLILAAVTPADYVPCTPGLTIEYRRGEDRVVDRVIGMEQKNLCKIERDADDKTEAYLLEILHDRVLYAGYDGELTALRPAVLKGPIRVGTTWTFKKGRYRILAVDECVVAGRKERCVTVLGDGPGWKQTTRYARGIGLVMRKDEDHTMMAIRVTRGKLPRKKRKHPK